MGIVYGLIAAVTGYLIGSIPFGYIYVKLFKGIDLREFGSGRTGGTNSLRAAGLGVGLMTSFSDVFKGFAAAWLMQRMGTAVSADPSLIPWLIAIAGIFSVIGHNWSLYVGFRGGAGTGPNVGWGMAVWFPIFPLAIVVMSGLLLTVGMASVASMAMAAILPIAFFILFLVGVPAFTATPAYIVGSLISAAIIVWALRPNIRRLVNGTERVVGPRARRIARRKERAQNQQTNEHLHGMR